MDNTYVVTKTTTNETTNVDTVVFLRMFANNGIYFTVDISDAIIFHNSTIATKQSDVIAAVEAEEGAVYEAKEVVLEDLEESE